MWTERDLNFLFNLIMKICLSYVLVTCCNKIGHYIDICKNVNKEEAQEEIVTNKIPNREPMKEFRQTKYERKEGKHVEHPIIVEEEKPTNKANQLARKDKFPDVVQNLDKIGTSGTKEIENLVKVIGLMPLWKIVLVTNS